MIVGEEFRRRGYGSDIIMLCEDIAQKLGYINITADLLYSPKTLGALQLVLSKGYMVTGQLPKCAFVKDIGLTSSFILHKKMNVKL